jgi:hypothetical protein
MPSMKKFSQSFSHNWLASKTVLYLTLAAVVFNFFFYMVKQEYAAIVFFCVSGVLFTNFSKNMIVVLLGSLVSTMFLYHLKKYSSLNEGFTSGSASASASHASGSKKRSKKGKKNDEAFMQQLNPARVHEDSDGSASDGASGGSDGEDDDFSSTEVNGHVPKINYASTLETAYDNLDKLLSSDAIKNMSVDTQRLADKQQALMGNIAKLEPMMKTAQSMLTNLNVDGLTDKIMGFQDRLQGMGMGMGTASGSASASASGRSSGSRASGSAPY